MVLDELKQLAPNHQLRHDVYVDLVLHQLKSTNNVWMLGILEHLKLLFHQFYHVLVVADLALRYNLDRILLLGRPIPRIVNLTKFALAYKLTHLEMFLQV